VTKRDDVRHIWAKFGVLLFIKEMIPMIEATSRAWASGRCAGATWDFRRRQ
jgi:hypothetical protein